MIVTRLQDYLCTECLSLPLVVRANTVRTVTVTSTAMFSHTGASYRLLSWLTPGQVSGEYALVGSVVALK